MNKEAFVLTKVLLGKIKLHKYDQRKETKVAHASIFLLSHLYICS